jgi:MFS family permease
MNVELTLLYSIWSMTIISLILIPKKRRKEASMAFLFQHFITWFLGLLVVEWHLLEYPVRVLASVNKTSFTFEFFVYPVISTFFALYYPENRSLLIRLFYITIITTGLIVPEVIFEKYTDLIKYIHWEWYYSWISILLTLSLLRYFMKWFFKKRMTQECNDRRMKQNLTE